MPTYLPAYPTSYFDHLADLYGPIIFRKDLHYQSGSSDKVYMVLIVEHKTQPDLFYTFYCYGRNGSRLTQKQHISSNREDAFKKADEQIESKRKKGYKTIATIDKRITINETHPNFPSHMNFPKATVATKELALLMDKQIVLECTPPVEKWVYIQCSTEDLLLYNHKKVFMERRLKHKIMSPIIRKHNGSFFVGYLDSNNHIAIVDLLATTDLSHSDISKRQWRSRRAMLTEIVSTFYQGFLYGSLDLFDPGNPVYLSDYIEEEQEKIQAYHMPKNKLLWFRDINSHYRQEIPIKTL